VEEKVQMTTVHRVGATSAATLFGVAVTVVLTSLIAPKWTQAAGLDVWKLPELQNQLETAAKNEVVLNAEFQDNRTRMAVKRQLIDELLAERATLKEVAAQFLSVNQSNESCIVAIRASYKGATDEEKTARNVIAHAVMQMSGSFTERAEVMARLSLELRKLTRDPVAETR
jgi:hypothetical protein